MSAAARALALMACAGSSAACAATSPVLVEPRLQRPGDVRVQVGAAAAAPIGGDLSEVRTSREQLALPGTRTAAAVLPAAAVAYGARPGVAPVIRGSVGLAPTVEAQLQYGGRDIAVGARVRIAESRTEQAGATTLSVGLVGRALLRGRPEDGFAVGTVSDGVRGYGATLPVVLAWQSDAGLVIAYVAATAGFQRAAGNVAWDDTTGGHALSIGHVSAAGTFGLGVGFRKVRVVVELGARRDWLDTQLDAQRRTLGLWSATPAFSLGWTL